MHTPPLLTVKGLRPGPDFPTPRGALAEPPHHLGSGFGGSPWSPGGINFSTGIGLGGGG